MRIKGLVWLPVILLASVAFAENAQEDVERRTAEILKIDRGHVGEWVKDRGLIAVVGIAAREHLTPEEIISNRHVLAENAILDAKLKLAEKLGFSLTAENKRHLWGDSGLNAAGITTSSSIQFFSKHRILGATVLAQGESYHRNEYLMAVSLVWSMGLQESAAILLNGQGTEHVLRPGKYSLEEWLEKGLDISLAVGPRQYVDNKGKRHFIGIASMLYDRTATPGKRMLQERVLRLRAVETVAWSCRADVEATSVSEMMLQQLSVEGKERSEAVSALSQSIRQRFQGNLPPVEPIFDDDYIHRKHPLFPDLELIIYACELNGELAGPNKKVRGF